MLLKFIGKDGSMGLEHGKKYHISIHTSADNRFICVEWVNDGMRCICPYSSPQKFAANWEKG